MTTTLRTYLDERRVKTSDWNITGMGTGPNFGPNDWRGKFKIASNEYPTFMSLVHDHVFVHGKACSLLEKHKSQCPILIDLDFRYPSGGPLRRRFTEEHIRDFVAAYANAIARFFNPIAESSGSLQFFVALKPAPEMDTAKDEHKDGIHIQCPNITTTPEIQYAIRGYLLQTGAIERIFGSTGNTKDPKDCLDIAVIQHNNWFLYGACKPDKAWYKVVQIYNATIEDTYTTISADQLEEIATDTYTPHELIQLLSLQHGHNQITPLTVRTDGNQMTEWAQLVQRWGKGSNWAKPASHRSPPLQALANAQNPPSLSLEQSAADEMIQVSGMSVRSGYTTEDVAFAYKLVRECLNPMKRAKDYHEWVALGILLRNISPTEESLRAWTDFSRRVPGCAKTADSIYKDKWTLLPAEASAQQSGRKPLMMGTLHLWAKEDAEATYKAMLAEANREMALTNDSGTHVSIADQVIRMYRHEFRCTPSRKGATASSMDWYQFEGHTWHSLKTWMTVRVRLSNEVRNVYIQADREVGQRITDAKGEDERQRLEAKRENILAIEKNLQNSSFKDHVMKEITEKFYDEEFLQHMNQDPTTVGFSNGIIELRHMNDKGEPHVLFRPGRPDDCISFQMGRGMAGMEAIPYVPYDPDAESPPKEYAEIMDFFAKIYPDPVLREYALTLFASCLEGVNREQKFYIMTGVGSNGKSKIVELMSKTFGEYQETLGTTALTRKRPESGAANPDLVVLKCKRFVSMSEPDEGEKINTASMKQLSGEDTVKARALFQDQDQFVIMAKIFMLCNDLPPVLSTDGGTWRRLRVIPHVAKFVDIDKPIDPPNHVYHKDLMLESKIARWRPYFASLLIWYFEHRYLRYGLKEPAQVTAASNKYKEENDSFSSFCQECLIRETGAEVKANDVLTRYKLWLTYNPGKKVMQRSVILPKLADMYGQPIEAGGKVYVGVRLAEEGEDISGTECGIVTL